MAQVTNTFDSYDSIGNREDLSDVIYDISPVDTPFMSNIGRTKATNTLHEWQVDSLAAHSADNAVIDGDDATNDAVSATSRLKNYTQISDKVVVVSGTQEVINKAGRKSEVAYQVAKRGRELKRDMEARLTCEQGAVVGNSTLARECAGLETYLSQNINSHGVGGSTDDGWRTTPGYPDNDVTDGTQVAFTEAMVKSNMQATYTAGGNPDCLMVGPYNKRIVSGFSGIATLYRDQRKVGPAQIIGAADIYVSDFGELQVVPNRFQRDRTAFFLDKSYWAVAYLRPFQVKPLSRTGDAEKRQMLVEYTLEARNPEASAKSPDLSTS